MRFLESTVSNLFGGPPKEEIEDESPDDSDQIEPERKTIGK